MARGFRGFCVATKALMTPASSSKARRIALEEALPDLDYAVGVLPEDSEAMAQLRWQVLGARLYANGYLRKQEAMMADAELMATPPMVAECLSWLKRNAARRGVQFDEDVFRTGCSDPDLILRSAMNSMPVGPTDVIPSGR